MDNYETLLNFFDVFTDFATQPFWLTGESYGGHYIPTLAKRVLDGKGAGDGKALFARTQVLPCHLATLLPCHLATLLPCYLVTLLTARPSSHGRR